MSESEIAKKDTSSTYLITTSICIVIESMCNKYCIPIIWLKFETYINNTARAVYYDVFFIRDKAQYTSSLS